MITGQEFVKAKEEITRLRSEKKKKENLGIAITFNSLSFKFKNVERLLEIKWAKVFG